MINLLRLATIALTTAFLGSVGILSVLWDPSGDTVIRLARVWARTILKVCGVRLCVQGAQIIQPPGPYLFLSNHQSQFDILAVVLAIPVSFRIVAKRELFRIPIFGWVMKLAGFVGIDRTDRESAIRSMGEAADRLQAGGSLLVFAEGTRSADGSLLPFKKGGFILAIQSGVPLLPITIRGSRDILPKGSLRIRPGVMRLEVGDPIDPRRFTVETKESLMQEVRTVMERSLAQGPA